MNTSIRSSLGALALAAITLSACGGDEFDRDAAVDEMMEAGGLTEEQAECVVDGMVDEIGEERVMSDEEPTDEEMSVMMELSMECVGLTDLTIPDVSIPDVPIPTEG